MTREELKNAKQVETLPEFAMIRSAILYGFCSWMVLIAAVAFAYTTVMTIWGWLV